MSTRVGCSGTGRALGIRRLLPAGSFLSDTWDGGLCHCHLQTGVCLLVTAQGAILPDWEFVAWNTNTGIPGDAQS